MCSLTWITALSHGDGWCLCLVLCASGGLGGYALVRVCGMCLPVGMYVCMYEGRVLSEQEIDAIAARSKVMGTNLAADALKSE